MSRRYLAFLAVGLIIGFYVSLSATAQPTAENPAAGKADNPFAGKVVHVDRAGWVLPPSKDVRIEELGNGTFVVLPLSDADMKWEQWINLDDVVSFRVFESMEDANKSLFPKNRTETTKDWPHRRPTSDEGEK